MRGVSPAAVLEHVDLPLPGLHKKPSRAKGVLRWAGMAAGALGLVATVLMWSPWRRRPLDDAPSSG